MHVHKAQEALAQHCGFGICDQEMNKKKQQQNVTSVNSRGHFSEFVMPLV